MNGYMYLAVAILCEVIATSALKPAESFTRFGPSLIVILGYSVSFYCLSIVLKTIPVGVAYAIWCGMGIVLITLVGWLIFKQQLDLSAFIGMALIVAGVIVIYAFSTSTA